VVCDPSASNKYKIYLDGTQEAAGNPADPVETRDTDNQLGGRPEFDDQYFDGRIDDVRVYNRALSASEIESLAG
jgi:hypothetical protein